MKQFEMFILSHSRGANTLTYRLKSVKSGNHSNQPKLVKAVGKRLSSPPPALKHGGGSIMFLGSLLLYSFNTLI